MTPNPVSDVHFNFSGRSAIVTGAAAGIGKAIANQLARAGASVCLVDIDQEKLNTVAQSLGDHNHQVLFINGDLRNWDFADQVFDLACDAFGPIDTLVNCAGIFPASPFAEITADFWDKIHDLNLKAAMRMSQVACAHMNEHKISGNIVNIASINAFRGKARHAAYSASKAGLVSLTRTLALELAPSIRVNAIAPGPVDTEGAVAAAAEKTEGREAERIKENYIEKIPLQRFASPDEIAIAAIFLASQSANYITGTTLVADGGLTLS